MKKFGILLCIAIGLLLFKCRSGESRKETNETEIILATPENLREVNEKIAKNPNNPELFNQRAQIYLFLNNIDSAFRDINQALLLDSLNAGYFITLSDIYMASGMVQNTLASLEKALQIEPNSVNALLKKAELHLFFEQYAEVLNHTEKAINIQAINPKAYFIRGMTFKMRGDTANAIRNIQISVDQDQENYHAYIQLGILYGARSNSLAIEYYNNALNLNPHSIEALYNLAYFYQEHDMLNEALSTYTNLLAIDSTNRFAHYNMGYIHLVYLEMFREAIKYFNKALKFDPNYVEAIYNRGYCFELLGDVHNARADYNRALALRTNYELAIQGLNRLDR